MPSVIGSVSQGKKVDYTKIIGKKKKMITNKITTNKRRKNGR